MKPLDLVARYHAKWQLGFVDPEAMPDAAAALIRSGVDTPAVRAVAALVKPSRDEVDRLVQQIVNELNLVPMTDTEARWLLARAGVCAIAAGSLPPREGVDQLAYLCRELEMPDLLRDFVDLSANYDPDDSSRFDARIRKAAARVVATLGSAPDATR